MAIPRRRRPTSRPRYYHPLWSYALPTRCPILTSLRSLPSGPVQPGTTTYPLSVLSYKASVLTFVYQMHPLGTHDPGGMGRPVYQHASKRSYIFFLARACTSSEICPSSRPGWVVSEGLGRDNGSKPPLLLSYAPQALLVWSCEGTAVPWLTTAFGYSYYCPAMVLWSYLVLSYGVRGYATGRLMLLTTSDGPWVTNVTR